MAALTEEWFAYDGEDVCADYTRSTGSSTFTFQRSYVSGRSIDATLARIEASGAISLYLPDALGSAHAQADTNGALQRQNLYTAWGSLLPGSPGGSLTDRYGFTHREDDQESAVIFVRARTYDPRTGRALQRDPLNTNSIIRDHYSWVSNDPVHNVDPSGLQAEVLSWRNREDVKKMQSILKLQGYDLGRTGPAGNGIDGDYGARTRKAVAEFQDRLNKSGFKTADNKSLVVDGLWGPQTSQAYEWAVSKAGFAPSHSHIFVGLTVRLGGGAALEGQFNLSGVWGIGAMTNLHLSNPRRFTFKSTTTYTGTGAKLLIESQILFAWNIYSPSDFFKLKVATIDVLAIADAVGKLLKLKALPQSIDQIENVKESAALLKDLLDIAVSVKGAARVDAGPQLLIVPLGVEKEIGNLKEVSTQLNTITSVGFPK